MFKHLIERLLYWDKVLDSYNKKLSAKNGDEYILVRHGEKIILYYNPPVSLGFETILSFSTFDDGIKNRSYVFPNYQSLELFSNPVYSNDFEFVYYRDEKSIDIDHIVLPNKLDDDAFFQISTVTDLKLDRKMLEECIQSFDEFYYLSINDIDRFKEHIMSILSVL